MNDAKPGQYLTFVVNNNPYGVPIDTVREINRVCDITPVPQTPEYVVGVINLRGKVIPVVDIRMRFGFNTTAHTKDTCIVVIQTDSGQTGMIVDSVSDVVELDASQIEPKPVLGNEAKNEFIIGMGKAEERVIILVNVVDILTKLSVTSVSAAI